MQISKIKLTNFRNYVNQTFKFSENKNIIIGNNGVGKTNIVEAIYYLSLTKSFRNNMDKVLINKNSEFFTIEGTIKDKITNDYKITYNNSKKKVFINKNQIRKFSDYISKINVICYSSEDLKLIKDSPSVHRQLINMEISQIDNNYLKKLSIYNKILKQRNAYLKKLNVNNVYNKEFLYVLTEKLIEYGLIINKTRKKFIDKINEYLNDYYFSITKKKGLNLRYISDFNNLTKEELKNKYNKCLSKDVNYGNTSLGIHLDDFIFYINDTIAKDFLSEGQQKNAIISFKLSEIKLIREEKNIKPILILDDLFGELDSDKISKIFTHLKQDMQIFITTTDLNKLDKKILNGSKIFNINNEKIKETIYGN